MTMSNNTYNPNPNLRQILPSSGVYSPEEYANALIQNRNSQPLIRTPGALATNLMAAAINHLVPNPTSSNNAVSTGPYPDGSYFNSPSPTLQSLRGPLGIPDPYQLWPQGDGSDSQ